jgi:hypothetical protein
MISRVKNPINSQVSNKMQTLRLTSSQERNKGVKSKMGPWQCWLDFNIRKLIFYVLGTTNVILQVSDQDKCCLNHGFSLHYEFYDLALEISFLFTSCCKTYVGLNCHGASSWFLWIQKMLQQLELALQSTNKASTTHGYSLYSTILLNHKWL